MRSADVAGRKAREMSVLGQPFAAAGHDALDCPVARA